MYPSFYYPFHYFLHPIFSAQCIPKFFPYCISIFSKVKKIFLLFFSIPHFSAPQIIQSQSPPIFPSPNSYVLSILYTLEKRNLRNSVIFTCPKEKSCLFRQLPSLVPLLAFSLSSPFSHLPCPSPLLPFLLHWLVLHQHQPLPFQNPPMSRSRIPGYC